MKHFSLLLTIMLMSVMTYAQLSPIMVCNPKGTSCTPYYSFDEAVKKANAGDFIYLPGGNVNIKDTINKKLNFIGAGINPSESTTTGITSMSANVKINSNASGSTFEGIYFIGGLSNVSGELNNITLKRCRGGDLNNNGGGAKINNAKIYQSIFNGIGFGGTGGRGSSNLIQNCIVHYAGDMTNSTISNCVFPTINKGYYSEYYNLGHSDNTLIKSSILAGGMIGGNDYYNSGSSATSNTFSYCAFNWGGAFPRQYSGISTGTADNCYFNQAADSTFTNAKWEAFNWDKNYHVKSTSPAKKGGEGGTEMGIYGGTMPWNDNALLIPSNPHIKSKNIANETNNQGNLPVNIVITTGN